MVQEVAAAPPSREDIDTETVKPQEDVADTMSSSDRLLDALMTTLNWNNDTRRDPIIIVVIVTLLFL